MVELLRADLEALVEALIQRSGGFVGSRSWYVWSAPAVTGSPDMPKRVIMLGLFT